MNTHRQMSKSPKPLTPQQIVERFKRDLEARGYHVDPVFSTSPYAPAISVSAWPKRETKEVER